MNTLNEGELVLSQEYFFLKKSVRVVKATQICFGLLNFSPQFFSTS